MSRQPHLILNSGILSSGLSSSDRLRSSATRFRALLMSAGLILAGFFLFSGKTASAQTVQLPTLQVFNVSTAVKVPDEGYVHLGGIKSRSAGARTVGVPGFSNIPGVNRLFKNRGIGYDDSVSNVGVTTKIIIFEELEEEVMAEARRRQAHRADQIALDRQADRISRNVGRSSKR